MPHVRSTQQKNFRRFLEARNCSFQNLADAKLGSALVEKLLVYRHDKPPVVIVVIDHGGEEGFEVYLPTGGNRIDAGAEALLALP